MFHDTEEWYKVSRKTDSWFQKRHGEFGELSPKHAKIQKFHFHGLFSSKAYAVWVKEIQRSYFFWHKKKIQWYKICIDPDHVVSNDGLFLSKAYNVSAINIQGNYISWKSRVMKNLRENWLVAWKMTERIWLVFM